ncbi:DNA-processing protein DprA [Pseudonocardia sp. HH130630-07]|uniref:DNA-processing protein DprA n=1 Tax=Pseudonocardia sp. HH130630-07 TaxID=1690815 RepID=UPI000814DAB5|nr:DNA-processing protein DprA [Pseudonocardia sp. HH130630-07]ANY08271.1 DNA processing protein DprA [Pseudonocardia sp. HH130630-07]
MTAGPGPAAAGAPVSEEIRRARVYLSRAVEPPNRHLVALVDRYGPVEAADRLRRGTVPDALLRAAAARRRIDLVDADLDAAAGAGARLLVPEDPLWPAWPFAAFAGCRRPDLVPPVALWVRGAADPAVLVARSVTIVGARAATRYGLHAAADFATTLARHGIVVFSGAAFGVDAAAHRGALAGGGPTVAVLACGPDRTYPAAHEALIGRIAEEGLVLTEYPPGTRPGRLRFLVRNRLLAALGTGCLVVEAGARSGTQRTASDATALRRPVMAVPGPVTSALSVGCHELVRGGQAVLVGRPEDALEIVGRFGADLTPPLVTERRPTDGLAAPTLAVHDALPARSAWPPSRIGEASGVEPDGVRAALTELEQRGLVEYHQGLWQRPARRDRC